MRVLFFSQYVSFYHFQFQFVYVCAMTGIYVHTTKTKTHLGQRGRCCLRGDFQSLVAVKTHDQYDWICEFISVCANESVCVRACHVCVCARV